MAPCLRCAPPSSSHGPTGLGYQQLGGCCHHAGVVAFLSLHGRGGCGASGCLSEPAIMPCPAHPMQVAERVNASYLWILAPKEHEKGLVRRKNLAHREEEDIALADFYEDTRNLEDSEQGDDHYSDFLASRDQAEATGSGVDDVPSDQEEADRSAKNLNAGADEIGGNGSSSDTHLRSPGGQTP